MVTVTIKFKGFAVRDAEISPSFLLKNNLYVRIGKRAFFGDNRAYLTITVQLKRRKGELPVRK
jgi:hypothetical protein